MKKIVLSLFFTLSFIFCNCSECFAGRLCDCFGSCIEIYERNVPQEVKHYVKKRDGYIGYKGIEVDHKIPLCLGGSNGINNLQALPKSVHKRKTKHDLYLLESVKNCDMSVLEAFERAKKYNIK